MIHICKTRSTTHMKLVMRCDSSKNTKSARYMVWVYIFCVMIMCLEAVFIWWLCADSVALYLHQKRSFAKCFCSHDLHSVSSSTECRWGIQCWELVCGKLVWWTSMYSIAYLCRVKTNAFMLSVLLGEVNNSLVVWLRLVWFKM